MYDDYQILSEEQITEIQELAGCFFSVEEILKITQIQHQTKEFLEAVEIGRLKNEAALRKSIFDLAIAGSSPAQTMALKMMERIKRDEF